jgi:hypothetical protein
MTRRKTRGFSPADPTPLAAWRSAASHNTLQWLCDQLLVDGLPISLGRLSHYASGRIVPGPRYRQAIELATFGEVQENSWYVPAGGLETTHGSDEAGG